MSETDSGTDIYQSTDNGINWSKLPHFEYQITDISAVNGVYIIGTGLSGVFISFDNGVQWAQVSDMQQKGIKYIQSNNGIAYLFSSEDGSYTSLTNGLSWKKINDLDNLYGSGFIFSGNRVVFGSTYTGAYISDNNGLDESWSQITQIPNNEIVTTMNSSFQNLIIGTTKGLYFSTNSGDTWSAVKGITSSINSAYID